MSVNKPAVIGGSVMGGLLLVGLGLAIVSPVADGARDTERGSYTYADCMDDLYPKAGDADDIETLNIRIAAAEATCEDHK